MLKFITFFYSALAVFLTAGSADSAPVTFSFEAEITELSHNSQEGLPFNFSRGDKITGLLKIDADPLPSGFEVKIGGTLLTSERLDVSVFNDTSFDDGPFDSRSVDVIRAGCGIAPSADCLPARHDVGDSIPFVLRAQIELIGQGSTLDSNKLPSSGEALNSLDLQRTLTLSFDIDGPRSVGLSAAMGSFVLIPEPAAASIMCLACLGACAHRWNERTRTR